MFEILQVPRGNLTIDYLLPGLPCSSALTELTLLHRAASSLFGVIISFLINYGYKKNFTKV